MNSPDATSTADLQLLNQQLQGALEVALQRIDALEQQNNWFKKQLFGEKSEKRKDIDNPDQMDLGEAFKAPTAEPPPEKEKINYERRKKQRGNHCVTDQGLRFDENVPVKIIEEPVPELEGPDADQYEIIDYKVTRRLAQRPGSYVVLEHRRPVVRHKPSQTLRTVSAPSGLFDRSIADVSLIAGMLIDKFVCHLPLHRQHQRMAMSGVTISRSTLTQLAQRGIELLRPIYDALMASIIQSKVLAIDETPIKAGRKEKGKMQKAWFWPVYGIQDEVVFTFSTSKSAKHLKTLLKEWEGVMLTDGNPVYDSYCKSRPEVTLAQCWVHCRRYFIKAEQAEPEAVAKALNIIGRLYHCEATIREAGLSGAEKKACRQQESAPLVNEFFSWCQQERQRMDLTATNPLSRALGYACNHEKQMRVFLENPDVPLDTNHLERSLRCIPMGRKNYMFCWTELGAEHVGIIQSLLVSCRLQGVDPYKYLVDVLQRISMHPAREVEDLIPRNWQDRFGSSPLKAPLDK